MRLIKQHHKAAPKAKASKTDATSAARVAPDPDSRELWEEAALRRISVSMVRKLYTEGVKVHVGGGVFETLKLPVTCLGSKRLIPKDGSEVFWARVRNAPPAPKRKAAVEGDAEVVS